MEKKSYSSYRRHRTPKEPTVNNVGLPMPAPANVSPPVAIVKPEKIKSQPPTNIENKVKLPKVDSAMTSRPLTLSNAKTASFKPRSEWISYMMKISSDIMMDPATKKQYAKLRLINKQRKGGFRDWINPQAKKDRIREMKDLKSKGVNFNDLYDLRNSGQAGAAEELLSRLPPEMRSVAEERYQRFARAKQQSGIADNLRSKGRYLQGTSAGAAIDDAASHLDRMSRLTRAIGDTSKSEPAKAMSGIAGGLEKGPIGKGADKAVGFLDDLGRRITGLGGGHAGDALKYMAAPLAMAGYQRFNTPPAPKPVNLGRYGKLGLGLGALVGGGMLANKAMNMANQPVPGMGPMPGGYGQPPMYDIYQGMPPGYGGY